MGSGHLSKSYDFRRDTSPSVMTDTIVAGEHTLVVINRWRFPERPSAHLAGGIRERSCSLWWVPGVTTALAPVDLKGILDGRCRIIACTLDSKLMLLGRARFTSDFEVNLGSVCLHEV